MSLLFCGKGPTVNGLDPHFEVSGAPLSATQEDRRALFRRVYIYNSRCGFIQAGIFGGEECQTCRLSLLEGLTREALTSSID